MSLIDGTPSHEVKKSYLSLRKVFFITFSLIFFLSASVVVIAYLRILDFQSLLTHTTIKSMPKVMTYAKMYQHVNELTYATGALASVNTQGQRTIAYKTLQEKISNIPPLVKELNDDTPSLIQLKIITQEINGLNILIKKRLNIQKELNGKQQEIYNIYDDIKSSSAHNLSEIALSAVMNTEQALDFRTLNKINKNKNTVRKLLNELSSMTALSSKETKLIYSLSRLLIGDSGVIALRTQQLKIFGRTRGRTALVRNLVIDYARLAEFYSFRYNKKIIHDTKEFSVAVEKQTKILGIFSVFVVVLLILIIFFMQHRFINRLVLLNNKVRSRLAGEPYTFKIDGNDEITDIARSLHQFDKTIEQQQQELIRTSLTDSLTDIPNRRGLDKEFEHLLLVAQRQQWPICVLMMDVDNFKKYNDFYGHVSGDECLQKIANILKTTLRRPEDFVARYGGEEFVCLLPNTQLEGAKIVAQAIIDELKKIAIPHEQNSAASHVTLSIGISISNTKTTRGNLLEQADNALYRAKGAGKNQFII